MKWACPLCSSFYVIFLSRLRARRNYLQAWVCRNSNPGPCDSRYPLENLPVLYVQFLPLQSLYVIPLPWKKERDEIRLYPADIFTNHPAGVFKFLFFFVSQRELYDLFDSVFSDDTRDTRMDSVLSVFPIKQGRDRQDFF